MILRPPISTRTYTLFPDTTLFRSDHVHEDPTSQVVVNDVLVYIARHFMDMERRRRWMVDMIDTAMPATRDPAEKDWRFGDVEFHLLMDALYTGLRGALETAEGRSEAHTSELQSLMRISYAVFC